MIDIIVGSEGVKIPCNFCIDLEDESKELKEGNNSVKVETVLRTINIPYSPELLKLHNKYGENVFFDAYLGSPLNKNIDFKFKLLSDKQQQASVELRIPISDNALKCLSELKLCDVDLGTITIDDNYVLSKFSLSNNPSKYKDDDDGVMIAPIDFGGFSTTGQLSFKDLRLLISDLFILQKASAQCGFCFNSPVMQSCRERHSWSYWLKKNWWEYEGKGKFINAEGSSSVESQAIGVTSFVIPIDTEINDIGNNLDVGAGIFLYTNNYYQGIESCICYKGNLCNNSIFDTVVTFLGSIDNVGNQTGAIQFNVPANSNIDVSLCIDYFIPVGSNITLFTFLNNGSNPDSFIDVTFKESNISLLGKDKHFYKGDEVNVSSLMSCDKTALDVLKSNMHLYCGIVDYDSNNLFMSTPYDVDLGNEKVKGYYNNYGIANNIDVECFSKTTGNIIEANNNIILQFADSNDNYIDSEIENGNRTEDEGENGVLSYSFEIGTDNDKETKKTNPCYEPTLNDIVSTVNNNGLFWLPKMTDSDEGINSCINPRKLYIYNGQQIINGEIVGINYEGSFLNEYPTAYQELPDSIDIQSNPDFNRQQLTMSELYEIYCKEWFNRTAKQKTIKFCTILTYKDYLNLSFRTRIRVPYKDRLGNKYEYLGVLKKKRYNTCGLVKEIEIVQEDNDC